MAPGLCVTGRVREREAGRMAVLGQLLAHLQIARKVGWKSVEPGLLHPRDAIVQHRAAGAERQADPLALVRSAVDRAVASRRVVPSAVLLSEVLGEIGELYQLVGKEVRVL